MNTRQHQQEAGLAMVAVLLVLLSLLVLCTPFLLTVGNTDKASGNIVDRAQAELALDSATRHARSLLGESHPGVDPTPWADSAAELEVTNTFDAKFLNPRDPTGVMWDLDVIDVAGRIDLNTAPPQLIANLIGGVARVLEPAEADATSVRVNSTAGFEPEGFLLAGRELIAYTGIDGNMFTGLQRGLGVELDEEGNATKCGPQPPHTLAIGAVILDQRAFALVKWRIMTPDQQVRFFDAIEQVSNAQAYAMVGSMGEEALVTLSRTTTPYGGIGAGPKWQNAVRVVQNIEGEMVDCVVRVADGRYFNVGTTVQITDGETTELGIVRDASAGAITITGTFVNEYFAHQTVVRALARRPVDINTADDEVLRALVLNLRMRRSSKRITELEARALVEVILTSRPFDGFEDFVRRVILPSAGLERLPKDAPAVPALFEHHRLEDKDGVPAEITGFIDQSDAIALYKNALNANDNELAFSTMPFSFVTRDVYEMQLRASVNKKSGVERVSAVREQVELIVPQRPLMQIWHRQSDFDLFPRFARLSPGWLTGPETTTRYDNIYKSSHPTRSRAHLGPYDTQRSQDPLSDTPTLVYASREDNGGWLQPWAARMEYTGESAGRVFHFDDESRSSEGRYLPDGTIARVSNDGNVGWSLGGLMGPMSFAAWIQPKAIEDGARFLDAGGPFNDSDRISLLFDEGELVFRILDGAGDHPDSPFEEIAEIRYPFAGEKGPGIDVDTWVHVAVTAEGNRPDQMTMLVDGKWWANTPGLTRLTSAISAETGTIPVESTEGFPDSCVIRIGNELIEVVRSGSTSFTAQHQTEGEYAGFGGRSAREDFLGSGTTLVNVGVAKAYDHPEGAAVQLYGYARPVLTNVPSAGGVLASSLGLFGIGRVSGIVKGGGEKYEAQMEPILLLLQSGFIYTLGYGMDGMEDHPEALILEPADPGGDIADVMEAFSTTGGYAALLSLDWNADINDQNTGSETFFADINGTRIGDIEVIYYSGWQGNQLMIQKRGDNVAELKNLTDAPADIKGKGSFIFHFNDGISMSDGTDPDDKLYTQTMVIPISVPVTGGSGLGGFLPAQSGESQFAQITHVGSETPQTEWVRYDEVVTGHLVRDDPAALVDAQIAAHADRLDETVRGTRGDDGSGGFGSGSGNGDGKGGGGESAGGGAPPPPASSSSSSSGATTSSVAGSWWDYDLGEEEDYDLVVTHAVRTAFQHRGVFGTYPHDHPSGTTVLPVWQMQRGDVTGGWAGRLDWVMLMEADPSAPGWPVRIHFTHRPTQFIESAWQEGDPNTPYSAERSGELAVLQTGMQRNAIYAALQESAPVPLTAGRLGGVGSNQAIFDTRHLARVSKFPSGERPREVVQVQVGGDFRGGRGAGVPSAMVDELVFGASRFGLSSDWPDDTIGGQLVLAEELGEGEYGLEVIDQTLRIPLGSMRWDQNFLSELPETGGVLRIGDELAYFEGYDLDSNVILLSELGRGLLGTEERGHAEFESVTYMPSIRGSVLTGNISASDFRIPIASMVDFPPSGTVLIDDELIHYDYVFSDSLVMARGSTVPGAMDSRGGGLFRGRFGTIPDAHSAGAPVILFPFRYWDRWAENADAPEMHYFGMYADQPTAFWRSIFWEVEEPKAPGPRLGVLLRTDPDFPWDDDPDHVPELELLWDGRPADEPNLIGTQADRIDWRFFVGHDRSSFDPELGTANGWKMTPRLKMVGVEYIGPGQVLRRVER